MNLRIEQIRLDGGTQTRAELSISEINDYAEAMRKGDTFPAIVVFYDGKAYWLADGFHRVQAAISADKKEILADVRQGTKADAVWFSCSANAKNGLRRTNEDKRRAVLTALAHVNAIGETDRRIAAHCGVDHKVVTRLRDASVGAKPQHSTGIAEPESAPAPSEPAPEKRTGKDGKSYNAKKPKKLAPVEKPESEAVEDDPVGEEGNDRQCPAPSVSEVTVAAAFSAADRADEIAELTESFIDDLVELFSVERGADAELRSLTESSMRDLRDVVVGFFPHQELRGHLAIVKGGV